ncbi:flavin reductase family protein [Streptomyces scopuliridis]|uniref:flavin reductase family protein n=1 Tax=Streptomyces scopuliridis TaxID=452529 RepID=UPI0035E11D2F
MVDLEPNTGDPELLKRAYGCFPSGVTAICGMEGDKPIGIAASTFTSVSLEPSLASVCVQNTSTTWPRLRGLRRLGVSMLAQDQNEACRTLSQKTGDRFARVEWSSSADGAVFVHGAVAWFDCTIHQEFLAGDHAIVLLAIHALRAEPERAPLVFHGSRFRRLVAV